MPTLLEITAVNILDACIASDIGIVVRVINAPDQDVNTPALRAKQVLYRFKKDNPNYNSIQIRLSPDNPNAELWLIKTPELIPEKIYVMDIDDLNTGE